MEMGSTSPIVDPIDIPIVPSVLPIVSRTSVGGVPPSVVAGRKQASPSLSMILSESIKKPIGRKMSIDEIEYEQCRLEPKTENRIVIINDEVLGRR